MKNTYVILTKEETSYGSGEFYWKPQTSAKYNNPDYAHNWKVYKTKSGAERAVEKLQKEFSWKNNEFKIREVRDVTQDVFRVNYRSGCIIKEEVLIYSAEEILENENIYSDEASALEASLEVKERNYFEELKELEEFKEEIEKLKAKIAERK